MILNVFTNNIEIHLFYIIFYYIIFDCRIPPIYSRGTNYWSKSPVLSEGEWCVCALLGFFGGRRVGFYSILQVYISGSNLVLSLQENVKGLPTNLKDGKTEFLKDKKNGSSSHPDWSWCACYWIFDRILNKCINLIVYWFALCIQLIQFILMVI